MAKVTLTGVLRAALFIAALSAGRSPGAQQTADDIRGLSRNPLADAVQIPIGESVSFGGVPNNRVANSIQLLPILPLSVTQNWMLIPRIVTTVVAYQPDVTRSSSGSTGTGDTFATFFLTPIHTGKMVWGAGPSLLIPTSTSPELGSGKWGLGPAVGLDMRPAWGSFWIAAQNLWSLPGHQDRSIVNKMIIETNLSYNLPNSWYLFTNPTINSDWTESGSDRWQMPCGGGLGRSFKIGSQGLDWNVALYYNAVRAQLSPKWQLSTQFTIVLPLRIR